MSSQTASLQDKVIFITGASRGIGREIALAAAQQGAHIVIGAKSVEPHPKLPGTIYTVAEEVRALGAQALPLMLDVRDEAAVQAAMQAAGEHFGGIDMLINNAGAIRLEGVEKLAVKRYDLMHQVNARAVMLCSQAALPWLKKSQQAHILSLSPPINLDPKWLAQYGPYTTTKYAMTLLSIGMAAEFRRYGIAVNTLWPRTIIATAAIEFEAGGRQLMDKGRSPRIMADAALAILSTRNLQLTGHNLIDEDLLREQGVTDFEDYRYAAGDKSLMTDLFID